jgi:hypothetical protein
MTGLPPWETNPILPYPVFEKISIEDMRKK